MLSPNKKNDKFPAKTIVRFTNRKAVEFCLKNRDRLLEIKNEIKMNLRFLESLCSANEDIVSECYKLRKHGLITDYFIRNGFVKVIKKEGDKPLKMYHPYLLYDIFFDYYDQ